jgi:serine/threonine-protein kinase
MLGPYGETLVVDWGLAKPIQRVDSGTGLGEKTLRPLSASDSAPTVAGTAVGTPAYMSPEQAEGRLDLLGPASDVYSLGATLYCLLTGQPPFTDPDVGRILDKVTRGEFPRPRQVRPEVPPGLEAVCLKAMSLKPEARYPSPRALADDVKHWLADEPVSAWAEPRTARLRRWLRRHRNAAAAAVVLLVAVFISLLAVAGVLADIAERERQARTREMTEREKAEQARDDADRERKHAEQAHSETESALRDRDRALFRLTQVESRYDPELAKQRELFAQRIAEAERRLDKFKADHPDWSTLPSVERKRAFEKDNKDLDPGARSIIANELENMLDVRVEFPANYCGHCHRTGDAQKRDRIQSGPPLDPAFGTTAPHRGRVTPGTCRTPQL